MDNAELRIEKVGRVWWLYEGDNLLAVTMYKVGALTVGKRIEELKAMVIIERNQNAEREEVLKNERRDEGGSIVGRDDSEAFSRESNSEV